MSAFRVASASVATLIVCTSTAHAYIDPGTGSMLLQMLGAGVAGAFFYFSHWRRQILNWFRGRKSATEKPPGESG